MRFLGVTLGVAITTGALLTSVPARADDPAAPATQPEAKPPDYEAAKRHYKAAVQAEQEGRYATAASEYVAAYDITKDPKILYTVARVHEQAGNKAAAAVFYRRYLHDRPDAADAADVKAKIAALEGTPAPETQPAEIRPNPDKPPPAPGDDDEPLVPDAPPSFMDDGPRWQRTAGWVSVGVAATALTVAGVLAESAASRAEDMERLQRFRDPTTLLPTTYTGNVKQAYEEDARKGKDFQTYSRVAFGVAGAATVAAVIFFIMDPGPTAAPEAISQRRVTPLVSTDSLGVSAAWSF